MNRRFRQVTGAVAWRTIHNFATNPAYLLPSLLFPLFFFTAFAGGLSRVDEVPGFDYPAGYTAFQFAFVLLQASAFGGIFTGFSIARDFETGFGRRLLLSAPNRLAIVAGYAIAAATRAVIVWVLLFVIAVLAGMQVLGSPLDLAGLFLLAAMVNLAAVLFASGVALRARTIQAGPLMQMPAFLVLFLAPVYVPADLLVGWVETAAAVNPFTALVEAARAFLAGTDVSALLAYGVAVALIGLFFLWARGGMRRAEAAG